MLASRQIVNAMVDRLMATTDAGTRVYPNRAWPVTDYPTLKVAAGDEQLDDPDNQDITWPRERQHTLQVVVLGVVRDTEDLESAMDELVEQVLIALEGSEDASRLTPLPNVRLYGTRVSRQVTTDGEAATGTVIVYFEAAYHTASNNPSVFLF